MAKIHELTDAHSWHHVSTHNNPADVLSRGTTPDQLINTPIWENGPSWLILNENKWLSTKISLQIDIPEKRKQNQVFLNVNSDFEIFNKFSSLIKL